MPDYKRFGKVLQRAAVRAGFGDKQAVRVVMVKRRRVTDSLFHPPAEGVVFVSDTR